MFKFANELESEALKLGVKLNATQIEQILTFANLLKKWNKTYNLTSITDDREILYKHILDCLAIIPFIDGFKKDFWLDVGSGAGFPGILMAIYYKNTEFYLLDAVAKKIKFLTQVKIDLKLDNIQPTHFRIEKFQFANKFNIISARAFAKINFFLEISAHLSNENTKFLSLKGKLEETEINEINKNFIIENVHNINLETTENRCLAVIKQRG